MRLVTGITIGLLLSYFGKAECLRQVRYVQPALKTVMQSQLFEGAANIGFIYLMFLAGWSVQAKWMDQKAVLPVALFGFAVTFCASFLVARYLFRLPFYACLAVAISLSITAEAPTVAAFDEWGIAGTQASSVVLSAGMIDDITGLVLFVAFALYCRLQLSVGSLILPVLAILLFFIGYYVGADRAPRAECTEAECRQAPLTPLKSLVYFFFLHIGYNVDVLYILNSAGAAAVLFGTFLLVAVASKVGGVYAGLKLYEDEHGIRGDEAATVAWGMNSRGIIGMAVVLPALKSNIISRQIYTMLIIVSLVTILMLPAYLSYARPAEPILSE